MVKHQQVSNYYENNFSITNLATTTALNAKIIEVKKTHNITSAAIITALTVVENKIPNVSYLVKKIDYNTKSGEIENKLLLIMIMISKYITTHEFNKLTSENVYCKISTNKFSKQK